jgi:hypothetical protein
VRPVDRDPAEQERLTDAVERRIVERAELGGPTALARDAPVQHVEDAAQQQQATAQLRDPEPEGDRRPHKD